MDKVLGKISEVKLGFGGYDDAMFGVEFSFVMKGSYVKDWRGPWAECRDGCALSEQTQKQEWASVMEFLRDTLMKANKRHVYELVGVPVEVTFENRTIQSWRVLEEVI